MPNDPAPSASARATPIRAICGRAIRIRMVGLRVLVAWRSGAIWVLLQYANNMKLLDESRSLFVIIHVFAADRTYTIVFAFGRAVLNLLLYFVFALVERKNEIQIE